MPNLKLEMLRSVGLTDDEIGFLLAHQTRNVSLNLVPPGLSEKAAGLGLPVKVLYMAECDECAEPNSLQPGASSFTCRVCRHPHEFINPDARLEIGTLMTASEMAESLQGMLVGAGVAPNVISFGGDELRAGSYRYHMIVADIGLPEVFWCLDADQVPITLVTAGRVLPEARFRSERINTEIRVLEFHRLLEPVFLAAEVARVGKALPKGIPQKRWSQLERQNARLQQGYEALRPLKGIQSLHAEMNLYLQGSSSRLPELFGKPEEPSVFCEYWVHFWFKIFGLHAYKLGMAAKDAGLINPQWPDGLVFLPKNRQLKATTTYLYDITIANDYAHELHQAVRYIRWYSQVNTVDYYYVITKEAVGPKAKPGLEHEWHSLCRQNNIEGVQAVYLSLRAMNDALGTLLTLPDFWNTLFCFELEEVLNRGAGFFAQEITGGGAPMFVSDEEMADWTQRTLSRAISGQTGKVREYEALVNDYGFMLQKKLPNPDGQAV